MHFPGFFKKFRDSSKTLFLLQVFFLIWLLVINLLYYAQYRDFFTSRLARYLLPVFPLALILVWAGVEEASRRSFSVAFRACSVVLTVFLIFGAGSCFLYAKDFLPVALGRESREAFLSRMAPDYNIVVFVNRILAHRSGRALVFFRHHYYLRVPFVYGSPRASWYMDPEECDRAEGVLRLLRKLDIRYVVKSPDYPEPLNKGFAELEKRGVLFPIAQGSVENFSGWRIYKGRTQIKVTILALKYPGK